MSPIDVHAYCILRVFLSVFSNLIYSADRLFTCLSVCLSVWPCVIMSVISTVYLSRCLYICLAFPPPNPVCPTESLSFGIFPLVPLPMCIQVGVLLYCLLSLSVSTCTSTYLVRVHLFFHHLFPTHLFVLLSVSNVIYSSPSSIQVHLFFGSSISKSTYSYTTLLLNQINVFGGIYFYIHPFLSHLFVYRATSDREINTSVSCFSCDDVSAAVTTLNCRDSYQ